MSTRRAASRAFALLAVALAAGCQTTPAPVEYRGGGRPLAAPAVAGADIVVRAGNSVYGLAREHGLPVRAIIEANNLQPPYRLLVGQRLALPAPRDHVVRKGDTIYGIARMYGVDMTALMRANDVRPPYTLQAGQRLRLPSAVAPPEAAPAEDGRSRMVVIESPNAGGAVATAPAEPAAVTPSPVPVRSAPPPPKSVPQPPPLAGAGFTWPARGKLVAGFGPAGKGQHNDGINIAMPRGTAVHAAQDGVVAYAGNELRGFGNLLLVKHEGGWMTAYAHLDGMEVKRGDMVRRGQVIAKSGATGNVRAPQLHFEIRKGTRVVDPMKHLRGEEA